ncbi:MAG: hypothetical protein KBT12_08945 [Bacteroidales bacterium]|nr:hypothetical protein [Candidatus Physcousia equi]
MKKILTILAVSVLMQSCFSSAGAGAAAGALTGGSLGGAIGGMIGGWRGHSLGTVVGVIAGAATGAAAASAAESRSEQTYEANQRYRDYIRDYDSRTRRYPQDATGRDNYEANRNNKGHDSQSSHLRQQDRGYAIEGGQGSQYNSCPLALRNLRFVDANKNRTINREEDSKIIFELANTTNQSIYDVVPYVYEVNGNPHITLSPSTRIEVVKPGDVVRYTCSMRSDNKLKAGDLTFRISVAYSDKDFVTLSEFSLPSAK